VRFNYYLARLKRNSNVLHAIVFVLFSPLYFSAKIRIKKKYLTHAPEWALWAKVAQKTFGFL